MNPMPQIGRISTCIALLHLQHETNTMLYPMRVDEPNDSADSLCCRDAFLPSVLRYSVARIANHKHLHLLAYILS